MRHPDPKSVKTAGTMTVLELKRAAIYARFSTDLQNERSCDDQAALCRQYAARERISVVAVYEDRAQSGASLIGRDGINKLLADAEARRFDVVIVEALDRLARDIADLATIHKRLTFLGVEIRAVHDGVADTVSVGLRGLVGQLFREDGAKKVRRGLSAVVRDGRSAGGKAFGYRPGAQRGELVIEPNEAAVIRRIFAEYVAGKSPREIAGGLNRDGIAPPRGVAWNASTINGNLQRGHGILLNPLYSGRIVWNRVRMVRDPATGRRVSRANPRSEWQETDAPHLRIIEPAVFAAAQARKASQSHDTTRANPQARRLFSGFLKCGVCGAGMTMYDKSAGRRRIICSRVKESRSCDNRRRFYLDDIEHDALSGLADIFDHPAAIEQFLKSYSLEFERLANEARRDLAALQSRRDRAVAAQRRLIAMVERGIGDVDELAGRLRDLETERKAAVEEIERADADARPSVALHPAALAGYAADLRSALASLSTDEPDRLVRERLARVLDALVVDAAGNVTVRLKIAPLIAAPIPRGWLGREVVAEVRLHRASQGRGSIPAR